ncbi:MAG: ATP synthase F1 subunit delta [Bacteroidota bacterium]
MKNPRAAHRYAHALMEVAEEQNSVDRIADDMAMIGRSLAASRELQVFLGSPVVPEVKKMSALKELFSAKVNALTAMFLELLVRKGREVHLQEIVEQFLVLRDEVRGIMRVDVTSVVPLDKKQEELLTAELGRRTGKTVKFRLHSDPALMGGLLVRIGDTVLDASVRRQLERLRERFAGSTGVSTL